MTELWTTLIPLAIATAVLPIQVAITILMLRSAAGRAKAGAWIGGMTLVRLIQYALFGLLLERAMDGTTAGTSPAEGVLLLVIAMFLLVSAARKIANQPDEDAPPRWMTRVDGIDTGRAFLMGAGLVVLSPKLWAFTLGAIGAMQDTHMDRQPVGPRSSFGSSLPRRFTCWRCCWPSLRQRARTCCWAVRATRSPATALGDDRGQPHIRRLV
ncbi:MAG: GAP family protein, partial [Chloroflexi bacterium]|nr:GAP family protein [Chloroflexota bacterium]